jgi:predicted transcriptional regulator
MLKKKLPKPTEGELAILRILWRDGLSTVRQVYSELGRTSGTGYTTTLKIMQIMAAKGLVKRDESKKTHVYSAAMREKEAKKRLVGDLLDQIFDGSAHGLVLQALSIRKASPAERAEIRQLLDKMEKETK